MDLTKGGARGPGDFVDSVHVNVHGIELQRQLFEKKLDELDLR